MKRRQNRARVTKADARRGLVRDRQQLKQKARSFLYDSIVGDIQAAYSVRRCLRSYAGPCMRIRRSSDSAELDVGFTPAGWLDTAAIEAFVTFGGSAFVKTWYDQSGKGRDATQTTGGNQPRIWNSAGLEVRMGLPSLRFSPDDSTLNYLTSTLTPALALGSGSDCTVLQVHQSRFGGDSAMWGGGPFRLYGPFNDNNCYFDVANATTSRISGSNTVSLPSVMISRREGAQMNVWRNGAAIASRADASGTTASTTAIKLGTQDDLGVGLKGYLSEIVFVSRGLNDSERTSAQSALLNAFNPISSPFTIDNFTESVAGAYSMRKLRRSYYGPCMRLRRGIDNALRDIGFDTDGYCDLAEAAAFATSGVSLFVHTWYDQSGNARDLTQTTNADQPRLRNANAWDESNFEAVPAFLGAQALQFVAGAAFITDATMSVALVAAMNSGSGTDARIFSTYNAALPASDEGSNEHFFIGRDGNAKNIGIDRNSTFAASQTGIEYGQLAQVHVDFDGSTARNIVDDLSAATAAQSANFSVRSISLGRSQQGTPAQPLDGWIAECIIFADSVGATSRARLREDQRSYWGTPPFGQVARLGMQWNETPGPVSPGQNDLESSDLKVHIARHWDAGFPGYANLSWSLVEQTQGVKRWDLVEGGIAELYVQYHKSQLGRDIIGTVSYCPAWARKWPSATGGGLGSVPKNMNDWSSFAEFVTRKAAGRIKFWEVINEPNVGRNAFISAPMASGDTSITIRKPAFVWPARALLRGPTVASPTAGVGNYIVENEVISIDYGAYSEDSTEASYSCTRAQQGTTATAHPAGVYPDPQTGFYAGTTAELVTMVRRFREQAKAADPTCQIIAPPFVGGVGGGQQLIRFLNTLDSEGVSYGRDVVDILSLHDQESHLQFSGNAMVLTALNTARYMRWIARRYGKEVWYTEQSINVANKDFRLFNATERRDYLRKMVGIAIAYGFTYIHYGYAFGNDETFTIVEPRLTGSTWNLKSDWNDIYNTLTAAPMRAMPRISGNDIIFNVGGTLVTY